LVVFAGINVVSDSKIYRIYPSLRVPDGIIVLCNPLPIVFNLRIDFKLFSNSVTNDRVIQKTRCFGSCIARPEITEPTLQLKDALINSVGAKGLTGLSARMVSLYWASVTKEINKLKTTGQILIISNGENFSILSKDNNN